MVTPVHTLEDLITLMSRLRDPEDGCPWDIKQSFSTIVSSTIEEAYEVADAIENQDWPHLKEELGDLLFQVIFYSQLGREKDYFDFHEVVDVLVTKLVRRHPHVFPDGTLSSRASDAAGRDEGLIKANWEATKQAERAEKGKQGVLSDVPPGLPALTRAHKLQKRASNVGFDWPDISGVILKLEEEIAELKESIVDGDPEAIEGEMGDVLFSCVNLARHLKVDSESAIRRTNRKFEQRFGYIEQQLAEQGKAVGEVTLDELEALWQQAK
ncbi:MAG: nucleoside triphosphate pyrophosphohydrolase [Cellvibrionaceae bacterium]